jgi:acetyltransferase
MTDISRLTASDARTERDRLIALLADTVNHGASVGFLRPLDAALARDYWNEVCAAVERGSRILLVARSGGEIVGSVQLDLAMRPNGRHRAEVQKLIVLSTRRRGRHALMRATEARPTARSLLVLDTEARSGAEPFYDRCSGSASGRFPIPRSTPTACCAEHHLHKMI